MKIFKERPILMCAEMVQATLRNVNPKVQTRRIIKPQPVDYDFGVGGIVAAFTRELHKTEHMLAVGVTAFNKGQRQNICPYGNPGDRLWVRETFAAPWGLDYKFPGGESGIFYRADNRKDFPDDGTWKPSIFMPLKLSRITLEIVIVRVERLHDISEADAKAEGIETKSYGSKPFFCTRDYSYQKQADGFWPGLCIGNGRQYRDSYQTLWEQLNGPGSWAKNPWVWVIDFKKI